MIVAIQTIPYINLSFAFIPVLVVLFLMFRWRSEVKSSVFAMIRMLIQLLLIGFVLAYIFKADNSIIVIGVLIIMLVSASWISLRTLKIPKRHLYIKSFLSIIIGGGLVLVLISQMVLELNPWYEPSYVIPLAGMIFANSMNSVSLGAERLESELSRNESFKVSRNVALSAALIPITNALFAVGLVSLPGMMTGQILSGVSPFVAARYQIMVMCMIFGGSGISVICFLALAKKHFLNSDLIKPIN